MLIEKVILDYLLDNGINAYAERPVNPPTKYVIVEKTSASEEDLIITSAIALSSYAPTLAEAMVLSDQVKALIKEVDTIPSVSASSLNSETNFTSPSSKQYRYQAVYDIVHKE